MNEASICTSQPSPFSFVQSKPTWLHHEELRVNAKIKVLLFCRYIWVSFYSQMKPAGYLQIFCFQPIWCRWFSSPLMPSWSETPLFRLPASEIDLITGILLTLRQNTGVAARCFFIKMPMLGLLSAMTVSLTWQISLPNCSHSNSLQSVEVGHYKKEEQNACQNGWW